MQEKPIIPEPIESGAKEKSRTNYFDFFKSESESAKLTERALSLNLKPIPTINVANFKAEDFVSMKI